LRKPLVVDTGWLSDFRADLNRYRPAKSDPSEGDDKVPRALLMVAVHRELWALLHYRLSRTLREGDLPSSVRRLSLLGMAILRRPVEMCSGIILPDTAVVGPGLRFSHPGPIVIHEAAVIGRGCLVAHGVTIGEAHGGVPVIGDGVVINTNAVVAGGIRVGDGAVVSACSLVTRDVPPGALARGVPAENRPRGAKGTEDEDPVA
jgi:serine O-acetyltransferase